MLLILRKLILFSLFLFPVFAFAQEEIVEESRLEAIISVDNTYVPLDKAVVFDALESEFLDREQFGEAYFYWTIPGEVRPLRGAQQIYTFSEPGKKQIVLRIAQGSQESIIEREIFVYRQKALLITDENALENQDLDIQKVVVQAGEQGTWLQILALPIEDVEFLSEERLVQKFSQFSDFILESNILLFDTESLESFAAFIRYYQSLSEEFPLENKEVVILWGGDFRLMQNIIQRFRATLGIPEILLTRPEALNPLFESSDFSQIFEVLKNRGIEVQILSETTTETFLVFSKLITYFISVGIPSNVLYLLLIFPFIAFFVAFSRQVIGLSTFGVYLPTMVALSFFILGISFTFLVIALVTFSSLLIRLLFRKVDLLHIPKLALTLSLITLSFFFVIWLSLRVDSSVAINLAIFPMLVISTLSERFIASQAEEGLSLAVLGMLETILVAFLSYLITSWSYVFNLIISFPEIILIPLFGIVLVGRYSGLRITEYFHYWSLFSRKEIEE